MDITGARMGEFINVEGVEVDIADGRIDVEGIHISVCFWGLTILSHRISDLGLRRDGDLKMMTAHDACLVV